MKKILTLFTVIILLSIQLHADEFIVKSFNSINNKILTNNDKVYDDNDELCAILMVRTSLTNLGVSASTPIIGSTKRVEGDIRVHLSAGTRMIKFFKDGFSTFEYVFPQTIEKGTFYLLELEYKRTDDVAVGNTMGFVIIESNPTGASVWIDGEETGEFTPFSRPYQEGYYKFILKKELNKDYIGDFTINANQNTELNLQLSPNYGSFEISTTPESGAEVIIDNINTGKQSPATIDFMAVGKHSISLKKGMYEVYINSFDIKAGQSTNVAAELIPAFGIVEITTNEGEEIFIDRKKMGTGNYKGRLIKGQHVLEVKKKGHNTETITLNIIAGKTETQTLSLVPITGVLSINSNPLRADILLNNKLVGQTPKFINNLMIGTYTLRLQKQSYTTIEKQIEITENQTTTINETLSSAVESQITYTLTGASNYNNSNTSASFTDTRDGHIYKTVKIGNQTWMAKNLNFNTKDSWCYDNKISNCTKYGRLYNWDDAMIACPVGWHLPSDAEWKQLEIFLGMSQSEADDDSWRGIDEGGKMKSSSGWNYNDNGTNSSGFNALPSGYCYSSGTFYNLSNRGYWWSSTEYSGAYAWRRGLNYGRGQVRRNDFEKTYGFSVRCLKN